MIQFVIHFGCYLERCPETWRPDGGTLETLTDIGHPRKDGHCGTSMYWTCVSINRIYKYRIRGKGPGLLGPGLRLCVNLVAFCQPVHRRGPWTHGYTALCGKVVCAKQSVPQFFYRDGQDNSQRDIDVVHRQCKRWAWV